MEVGALGGKYLHYLLYTEQMLLFFISCLKYVKASEPGISNAL